MLHSVSEMYNLFSQSAVCRRKAAVGVQALTCRGCLLLCLMAVYWNINWNTECWNVEKKEYQTLLFSFKLLFCRGANPSHSLSLYQLWVGHTLEKREYCEKLQSQTWYMLVQIFRPAVSYFGTQTVNLSDFSAVTESEELEVQSAFVGND